MAMVDYVQAALRHYEAIRPAPGAACLNMKADELNLWMEQDVCQVVEELLPRADFRAHACWPIERLSGQQICPERRLVNAVDDAIIACAQAMAAFGRQPAIWQQLLLLEDRERPSPANGSPASESTSSVTERLPQVVAQLEAVAARPWIDLVSVNDYFFPVSQLNLRRKPNEDTSSRPRWAVFLPWLNPRLRQLGDLVGRSMLVRVESWAGQLHRAWLQCHEARRQTPEGDAQLWEAVGEARGKLRQGREDLEQLFHGPDADRRDACIGLIQVIAAYRPRADLSWLGEVARLSRNASDIPDRVRREGVDLTDQVTNALATVSPLFQTPMAAEEIIAQACREHRLVMVSGVGIRQLYWNGQEVSVDWSRKTPRWEFLLGLAMAAMGHQGVDVFLEKTAKGPKSFKDRKYRLEEDLPADLYVLIKSAGRGTYRLEIPADEICLLEHDERSQVTPYLPHAAPPI